MNFRILKLHKFQIFRAQEPQNSTTLKFKKFRIPEP